MTVAALPLRGFWLYAYRVAAAMRRTAKGVRIMRAAEELEVIVREGALMRDEYVPTCGLYGCDDTPAGHIRAMGLVRTKG